MLSPPMQAGEECPSVDSEQVSVDPSGSRPRAPELRSGHAFKTEPTGRRMEAAISNGELHMESVWRGRRGLIRLEHDYALPAMVLPSPLGLDGLAHEWPRASLYAIPPIRLISVVLSRIRSDRVEQLLLVAPWWPTQPWFAELISLLAGSPWEIPLRQEMLSQARGMIWHPRPDLWKLWVWPLSGVS